MLTPAASRRPPRHPVLAGLLALSAGLASCAGLDFGERPGPGSPLSAWTERLGAPTGRSAAADGGERFEFARGPMGRETYMVDLDAQGRVLRWEQVLDEAHFDRITPGLTAAEVRHALGRPARVWAVHARQQTVWSFRYDTPMCRLFHVGLTPAGLVDDTSYGPDPLCDRKGRRG